MTNSVIVNGFDLYITEFDRKYGNNFITITNKEILLIQPLKLTTSEQQ